MAVLCIVLDSHFVVIEVNFVHESIDQCLLVFRVIDIALDSQALFNDKTKFSQFFDLINNFRADAHAKDIDEEDEALLNIAFKFFEKALQDF